MIQAQGNVAANDYLARILRIPKAIREALSPDARTVAVAAQGQPPVELTISKDRTYLGGVTTLFETAGLLRRAPGGTWEARAASASWQFDPKRTPPVSLTFTPTNDAWLDVTRSDKGAEQTVTDETLEAWRDRIAAARADAAWVAEQNTKDEGRVEAAAGMRKLLESLRAGAIDLEEFRRDFDQQTRAEWQWFGFKGMSGAMVLNKLVKHIPDHAAVVLELLRALEVPANEADGRKKMAELREFLQTQIAEGHARKADLQPNRLPFFLSAWWHVQNVEAWPVFYPNSCAVLRSDRVFRRTDDRADDYFRFRSTWLGLCEALGVSTWELEHVAIRETQPSPAPAEPQPAPAERRTHGRTWLFSPGHGARFWDEFQRDGLMAIGAAPLGRLDRYADLDAFKEAWREARGEGGASPVNASLASRDFVYSVEPGDTVIVKKGRSSLLGWGIVKSDYRYEPDRRGYKNVRDVEWHPVDPVEIAKPMVTKTLTNVTDYVAFVEGLRAALGLSDVKTEGPADDEVDDEVNDDALEYTFETAMSELFLQEQDVHTMLRRLQAKKNIVLQGPPGVGKTFVARRLAYLLAGAKDKNRVTFVQFHQSYAYEDFVQGYRPSGASFERKDGPFLRFAQLAAQDTELPHVMIIDEINRGNLSKIFGELLMLIEADKRSEDYEVSLTYTAEGDAPFFVPPNLYIIGTMNTADRSLAVVDYALRRRFAFIDIGPGFESPAFGETLQAMGVPKELREQIRARLGTLNETIRNDTRNLGDGYQVGHSYFCHGPSDGTPNEDWYQEIIETEIAPLLREYWFDDEAKASATIDALQAVD